jgi:hypothetical protein
MPSLPCHPCHAKKRDVHGRLPYPKYSHQSHCSTRSGERSEKSLVLYADDARPHMVTVTRAFCNDNFSRIAPLPPSSPNLVPSDFFLFLVSAP